MKTVRIDQGRMGDSFLIGSFPHFFNFPVVHGPSSFFQPSGLFNLFLFRDLLKGLIKNG